VINGRKKGEVLAEAPKRNNTGAIAR